MTTFVFESSYNEDDGGFRCDVISAPDRDTALRLAAKEIITTNGWSDGRGHKTLTEFYDNEMTILAEWEDLNGTACPNCTSHGGQPNGTQVPLGHRTAEVYACNSCHYEWVPLGQPGSSVDTRSTEEINAELDEWERTHMNVDGGEDDEVVKD